MTWLLLGPLGSSSERVYGEFSQGLVSWLSILILPPHGGALNAGL